MACLDPRMSLRSCELLVAADRPTDFARRANHFVFSEMACPAPFAKIFLFQAGPNQFTDSRRPVPTEGRCARHQRGAGCGGRERAKDEGAALRTAKSCGSDAPSLASSLRETAR